MKSIKCKAFHFKFRPTTLLVLTAAAMLGTAARAAGSGVLPGGGNFVAGAGTISGNANSLTINQNSFRGVIDWNSFSIGKGNSVSFNNGNGATLNRVTGGNYSSILGTLSATGSVYLINPQGIVIGQSGVVSTGGRFVASTLDVDNASFINGGPLMLTGVSKASVVNLGKIGSTLGDVFLVSSAEVDNEGSISAPKGTAELAAGQRVLLQDSSSGQQVFVQLGSKGTVVNRGTIEAAQISLQAADGNVFALSGNHQAIRATGTATRDGHVWLVANGGTVKITADVAAKDADGSGGTVDTTARYLAFYHNVPTVLAGVWNITLPSFTIGDIAAASISRSLAAGTSVNVQTTGDAHQAGDIGVASSIVWNGSASLALNAYHSVKLASGATLANHGSGDLTLRADSTAIDNGAHLTNLGTIDWSHSTGAVRGFYDSRTVGGGYTPGTQLMNTAWTPGPGSGLRTQITAYQFVNTLAQLQAINNDLSGNYALGRDIDASATSNGSFTPIGDGLTAFTGLFDGMGHQITSLSLVKTVALNDPGVNATAQGLFGEIGAGALVRDLSVGGTGHDSGALAADYGILAGDNYGTIENVRTSGNLLGQRSWSSAGGLVGTNYGKVRTSSSSVSIDLASGATGGLVGDNEGTITQSYATGSVGGQAILGGLVGYNAGTISQSYASGSLAPGESLGAGGLVGSNAGTIEQSYATGSIPNGAQYTGALVGDNSGVIKQSFATGFVAQGDLAAVGGIAGFNSSAGIGNDVYWNAQTSGMALPIGYNDGNKHVPPSTNGLTTAQMSSASSFVGYDFGPHGVWAMPAGATHPVLAWQVASPNAR